MASSMNALSVLSYIMSGGEPYILLMNHSCANPLDTSLHKYSALSCIADTEWVVIYRKLNEETNNNANI